MRNPQLVLVAAVLGSFLVGLATGYTLFNSPPTASTAAGPSAGSDLAHPTDAKTTGGATGARQSSSFGLAAESDAPLSGEKLRAQMWTTLTISDENERHAEWLALLKHLTKDDALEVRDMFRKMDKAGRHFDFEWYSFWPRWGQVDGEGALEFLKTHEWPGWRNDAATMLARGWASADPDAARRWLDAHPDSPFHDGAERGYFDGLARTNLPRATQEAIALATGDSDRMSHAMESLAERALQQYSLSGMVDWWNALPDDPASGTAKREAIGHVWYRLQFADPQKAADWMSSLAATPFRSDMHIGQTADRLAQNSSSKAMDWLASLPPSSTSGMYTNLGTQLRSWAGKDQPAAESWLKAQPVTPARDQAYTAYGYYLQSQNDPAAQQWLDAVQDKAWLTKTYNKTMHLSFSGDGKAPEAKEEIIVP